MTSRIAGAARSARGHGAGLPAAAREVGAGGIGGKVALIRIRDHAPPTSTCSLAYQGRWQRVGHWCGFGRSPRRHRPRAPMITGARGGIAERLDAGLVAAGEDLVWNCRNLGVRTPHASRQTALILVTGRVYANPSVPLPRWAVITRTAGKRGDARSRTDASWASWASCAPNCVRDAGTDARNALQHSPTHKTLPGYPQGDQPPMGADAVVS